MLKVDIQFFGGRGAGSSIPLDTPGGGGGGGSNEPLDQMPGQPATLAEALGTRGRPMSTDNAVLGANPFYDGGNNREYSENCQRAVVATEARFRGYNVIAQPTYDGDTMPYGGGYAKNFKGAKTETINRTTANAAAKDIEGKMSGYGDGSRAILRVQWKGRNASGHVMNVVQRNGKTYVYDGQTGKKYNLKQILGVARLSGGDTGLTRVDNLDFSDQARRAVRTNPKGGKK